MIGHVLVALAALVSSVLGAQAQPRPSGQSLAVRDPAAFTQAFAERMRREAPETKMEVAGPLQLRARPPVELTMNLDRAYNVCIADGAAACEQVTARVIASTREAARVRDTAARPEQLRIMVRAAGYCDQLRRLDAQAPRPNGAIGTFRPVGPGLCGVLVLDFPTTMRSVNADDLRALHLTAGAAWAVGERQVIGTRATALDAPDLANGLVVFAEQDYIPSLMLARDGWRRAVAHHGELVVAVPSDGHIVVMRRAAIPDLARFRALVRDDFAQAERGISPDLYRWTPAGWERLP